MKKDRLKEIERESRIGGIAIIITLTLIFISSALIIGYSIFKLFT